MPSTETTQVTRPVLGHVNLMVDTLIANATLKDLQAVVRTTLATSPPSVAGTFTAAARRHLAKTHAAVPPSPGPLFVETAAGWSPTPELAAALARSRVLYGAGMGLAGLAVLTEVVRGATGARWEEGSQMEDELASVDSDLTQAIQSTKEEIDAGRVADIGAARAVRDSLSQALSDNKVDVGVWGGDFPFERALASVELWKL